jgi:hypothetical protein
VSPEVTRGLAHGLLIAFFRKIAGPPLEFLRGSFQTTVQRRPNTWFRIPDGTGDSLHLIRNLGGRKLHPSRNPIADSPSGAGRYRTVFVAIVENRIFCVHDYDDRFLPVSFLHDQGRSNSGTNSAE